MKKIYIIMLFIISIGAFFLVKWQQRLLFLLICSGGILIILVMLALLLHNKRVKCTNCKSLLDKNMNICPYCGLEIEKKENTLL